MSYDFSTLGKRLIFARERAGLTQIELAKVLGVSQQAIQQWEDNRTQKPKQLYEASQTLKVSYQWLSTGNGNYEEILGDDEFMTIMAAVDDPDIKAKVIALTLKETLAKQSK